jgi:hypothetical protein
VFGVAHLGALFRLDSRTVFLALDLFFSWWIFNHRKSPQKTVIKIPKKFQSLRK